MDNADSRWQTYSAGLARELGGEMLHFEPQVRNSGGRQAFFADVAVGDNVRHLYVRAGRDMVPEEFAYADLSREKLVMDWLASRGVPVAAAVHLSREPVALAMEALQG